MKKVNLFVFDGHTDDLLTVLTIKNNKQLTYSDDELTEQLNKDFVYDFDVPMSHEDSHHLVKGNRIVFEDRDGDFQEFQIYKTEEIRSDNAASIRVYTEHTIYEINDDIVEDLRVRDGEASEALDKGLSASRWERGHVDSLGKGTVSFYYSNGMKNLSDIQSVFGGEYRFRVVLNEQKTRIEHRYVDLLVRRGKDTGKRFEYTKDIRSLKRTVDLSGIKTALYGRGNGEELDDGNGYSRKITIANVEWEKANGDPLEKPLGQEWLGDPVALSRYGREGGTRHRFGVVDVDSTDPVEIIKETYKQLMEVNKPRITIEVEGQDLELVGLEHEKVRLGDSVFVIDKTFNPELRYESRVIEIKRSLSNPENIKVTLGNHIPLSTDLAYEFEELKASFQDRKGVWDKVEDVSVEDINDDSFADLMPDAPTGVKATGLFKSIAVEWDFNPSSLVSMYEVYGSTIKDFALDSSNLLFRGKVGGYVQKADSNETWYFRVRAINTHGRKSPFSEEVRGVTLRVSEPDFEELSVSRMHIQEEAVDRSRIAKATITDAEINSLNVDKVNAGRLKADFVEIGSKTVFENGFNPATKATPGDVEEAEERAKKYAKPSRTTIFDPKFVNGQMFWSSESTGLDLKPMNVAEEINSEESTEGGKVLRLTNQVRAYALNPIPVNIDRVYRVTMRVRQAVDPTFDGHSQVLAGVTMLDANFNALAEGDANHRYCASVGSNLTTESGWQTFSGIITGIGDTPDTFAEGTKYVRPVFVVNYEDGDGVAEVDMVDFEDVTEIQDLFTTINEVSLRTTEESIISTVSKTLDAKVDREELSGFVSSDELDATRTELEGEMDNKISEIDFSPYATTSYVDQTAESLDFKFSSSGGVNLLKNSVGFAGTDFWTVELDKDDYQVIVGEVNTRQDAELGSKGVGSGFVLDGAKISQLVVNSPQFHTLAVVVKKGASGSGYAKIKYDNTEKVINFEEGTAYDYEKMQVIIEPEGTNIEVELYGSLGSGLLLTGIMLNVGNTSLQWQHSSGEVYNTNVLMDLNGIKVIANNYNGFTSITPEEFAGYAEVDGEMERVFTLNKDVTEMSKAKLDKELSMNPIKVVPVQSLLYNGWAFIEDSNENPNLVENSNFVNGMDGWQTWGSDMATSFVDGTIAVPKGLRVYRTSPGETTYGVNTPTFYLKANTIYTVSFTIQSYYNSGYILDYLYLRKGHPTATTVKSLPDVNLNDMEQVYGLDYAWRVEFKVSHTEDIPDARILIAQYGNKTLDQGFVVRELKIEEGNKRTTWYPE
ncbi:phage tail protein [Bacillus haynesii]|uniref:phage tail spike protein n=1 Tax=Bacillus haynesii TaxID=1925021 RepID=UPI002282C60B|nr:phage tail spike protein [Bacillus haynesii]MCY8668780.1 phage tail protein [Bacillus haynesii]